MKNLFLIIIALTIFCSCKKQTAVEDYDTKLKRYVEVCQQIELIKLEIAQLSSSLDGNGGVAIVSRERLMELMAERNQLEREKQRLERELNIKALYNDNIKPIKYICYS